MRADYDAKIAELTADLEGTRGEKEKTDTDMAILKVRSNSLLSAIHTSMHDKSVEKLYGVLLDDTAALLVVFHHM